MRPDLSSSQPARTTVSGPNDPTRTLEFIDTTHLPSHFRECQAMSSSGLGQARLAPSREQLIATGRIPIQAIIASSEADQATATAGRFSR